MRNDINKDVLLELSKRIKLLRQKSNLTQAECYNDTGINFGRIERGIRDASFTTLHKLCNYFDITLEDFLKGFEDSLKRDDSNN